MMFGPIMVECPACDGDIPMLAGVGSDTTVCPGCGIVITRLLDGTIQVQDGHLRVEANKQRKEASRE